MRKVFLMLFGLVVAVSFVACNDYETYGDKKEKERDAIHKFIADSTITVISEAEFHAKGDVTDLSKNEYVYLDNTGVYMQILRKGCGTPLRDGETTDLLMRFFEVSLLDTTAIFNDLSPYDVDVMHISRNGSTYTAYFTSGIWASTYGESVPAGLLVPFSYINVGRPRSSEDEISKVRLIVPHTQGHSIASGYVYPYFYEISFQRQTDL